MTLQHHAVTQPDYLRPPSIACASLLVLWLLMPTLASVWVTLPKDGWVHAALSVLFALAVLAAPLAFLGEPRRLFWVWLPLGLLSPLQTYLIYFFGSVPGDALTQSILRTSAREIIELLGALGWLPYLLPLSWLIYLALLRGVGEGTALTLTQRRGLLAMLLLYVMVGLFRDSEQGDVSLLPELVDKRTVRDTYPVGALMSLTRVLYLNYEQSHETSVPINASASPAPQLVILVIGETLRADHLGLNGYRRNTTPELAKMGERLLSFSDVSSTANYTLTAVHHLVSQSRRDKPGPTLVGAFREAGFTTAWLSNQDWGVYTPVANIEYFSETSWESGVRHDAVLLPQLSACLRQCGARQFIVLHILGSHFPYDNRYPADRKVFTPTYGGGKKSITQANKLALINSYDNSILETDRLLADVIAQADKSGKPAIVMFTSDHGENLFDDNRNYVLHSGEVPTRADIFVPLLLWMNDTYRLANPEKVAALTAHRSAPISHVDVMPTLLDLAGISYDGKRGTSSFASPSFTHTARFVTTDEIKMIPVEQLR